MDKRIVCCQTKSDKLLDKTGPYVKDKISRRRMTEPKGRMTNPTQDYIKDKYFIDKRGQPQANDDEIPTKGLQNI